MLEIEATERDLVTEVEELLAKAKLPERLYDIPHPEYAGANHRISDKPGAHWANFGHVATVVPSCAQLFALSPELLRRLVEVVKVDRDLLRECLPYVLSSAEASRMMDGFEPQEHKEDQLAARLVHAIGDKRLRKLLFKKPKGPFDHA